jgi:hypothetical protein
MRPNLVDARLMAIKNPKTFFVPMYEELTKLKPNMFVKICAMDNYNNGGERFWVRILENNFPLFKGVVEQSDMINSKQHGIRHGDIIYFTFINIFSVL